MPTKPWAKHSSHLSVVVRLERPTSRTHKACRNWHLSRRMRLVVAGFHRASPSTTLDKSSESLRTPCHLFNFTLAIIYHRLPKVSTYAPESAAAT